MSVVRIVCLVLSMSFFAYGLFSYFFQGKEITHFHGASLSTNPGNLTEAPKTALFIYGQYATKGRGFYAGKPIGITALLIFGEAEKGMYEWLKKLANDSEYNVVEGSEDPKDSNKDRSQAILKGNKREAFSNPGSVRFRNFNDEKQTCVIEGEVIFTRTGQLNFDDPLKIMFEKFNIRWHGIDIEPSSVGYQIESTRAILLLTWVTVGLALLSLFFSLRTNP
jgi:hypothetical protein